MTCTRKTQNGFTLVEAVVALFVLALLTVAALDTFHSGLKSSKGSEDRLEALTLAQKEIENVRQAAALSRSTLCDLLGGPAFNRSYTVDGFYRVSIRVDTERKISVAGSEARLGEVTVKVAWDRGKSEELTLSTLVDQAYY